MSTHSTKTNAEPLSIRLANAETLVSPATLLGAFLLRVGRILDPVVQAVGINIDERASTDKPEGICPAFQPNRITLHIPPNPRLVIAEVVVVCPGH